MCDGVYSPTNSPYIFLQLILDYSALTSFDNASNNEQLLKCRIPLATIVSYASLLEIQAAVSRTKAPEEKETLNYYNNDWGSPSNTFATSIF